MVVAVRGAKHARRAGKVVLRIYYEHETVVADAARRMGVTCKPGCAHCCMLPATATVPEMVPIVDHLTKRADWLVHKPELERALTRSLTELAGVNALDAAERAAFFDRQQPCVFLKSDQRCDVYPVRPSVCRYHMVVSPPENCAHGAKNTATARVNLDKLGHKVTIDAAKTFGELLGGPIALCFVLAADMLGVPLAIDRDLLKRVTRIQMQL